MCHPLSAAADFHSMSRNLHCLRPCLRSIQSRRRPQSLGLSPAQIRYYAIPTSHIHSHESPPFTSADAQQRWNELCGYKGSLYPPAPASDRITNCRHFLRCYEYLKPNETVDKDDVTLCGMPENQKWNAGITHAYRKDKLVSYSRPKACFSRHHPR